MLLQRAHIGIVVTVLMTRCDTRSPQPRAVGGRALRSGQRAARARGVSARCARDVVNLISVA